MKIVARNTDDSEVWLEAARSTARFEVNPIYCSSAGVVETLVLTLKSTKRGTIYAIAATTNAS